jgi:hypothetical protein
MMLALMIGAVVFALALFVFILMTPATWRGQNGNPREN